MVDLVDTRMTGSRLNASFSHLQMSSTHFCVYYVSFHNRHSEKRSSSSTLVEQMVYQGVPKKLNPSALDARPLVSIILHRARLKEVPEIHQVLSMILAILTSNKKMRNHRRVEKDHVHSILL